MSEELIIRHCSPTLAGLKTGNLFSCTFCTEEELRQDIIALNRKLVPKGLRVLPLRLEGDRALIYVYRVRLKASVDIFQDFLKLAFQLLLRDDDTDSVDAAWQMLEGDLVIFQN